MSKRKNKLIKKITINNLAEMINNGFNGQMEYMGKKFDQIDSRFEKVDKKLEAIEKDVRDIKNDLSDTMKRTDKLEMRVDYTENVLAIKKD